MNKKIVIVGGVAGGANAAARIRRLNEEAEVTIFERGPHVSFANCGLPYFVGGEIKDEESLLLHSPKSLGERFNMNVLVRHEVSKINRSTKTVTVKDLESGREFEKDYDELILATGASPIRPKLPGLDLPGTFLVRNVPDVVAIKQWVRDRQAKSAVVIGGGFIGLEMAEQLVHAGLTVTVIEALPQVMAPLDSEMAEKVHETLRRYGVQLALNDPIVAVEQVEKGLAVKTRSNAAFVSDLVVLSLGVRPESALARECGLELAQNGAIKVNDYLQSSDPNIWAIGDVIEVSDLVMGGKRHIPLAGPANRQGRVVAENVLFGAKQKFRGAIGTAILRVFDLTVATAGLNEKTLRSQDAPFEVLYLHPNSHAGYYPGGSPITMKVLFSAEEDRLLGVQAIGKDGVDKRVDVLATAIKTRLPLDEVADLELCYAPPFGSAKDPVNMVGMMAQNVRDGLVTLQPWGEIQTKISAGALLLDVRDPDEYQDGAIPGALNIPLPQLRERISELKGQLKDKSEVIAYCQSGQRSYYACRILQQNGIKCSNLSGAYKTYKLRGSQAV